MAKLFQGGIILPVLFAIFILFLSVMPTDLGGGPPSFYFPGMDKLIHAGMYGSFTMVVLLTYYRNSQLTSRAPLLLMLFVWLYSALMELVQYFFIEFRSGEWRDLIANLVGILLGALIVFVFRRLRISKS
jgi:VanZ family protein